MSVIYLRHPAHGTKVAISEPEALNDEKNGWERFELPGFAETRKAVAEMDDLRGLSKQYEDKFGKPPHHKMKAATIRERLA